MAEQDGPASTLAAAVSEPPRSGGRALKRADERMDEWIHGLSDRQALAYGAAMLGGCLASAWHLVTVAVPVLLPTAAAQAGDADQIMCGSGLGAAITLGFTFLAAIMVLVGIGRGVTALQKMGSARSDKKREGKEQLKGAAYSFGGVFLLMMAPGLLEYLGLATFSCVEIVPF